MKRELILKLTIDTDIWEEYDNISDELLFQDWLDSINISVRGAELELLSKRTNTQDFKDWIDGKEPNKK